MDKNGLIYADENPPEEDVERLKKWADDIEQEEIERKREYEKKFKELLSSKM